MTSRAEKLRSKRIRQRQGAGRPRKQGERYPSGDLKRHETEKEVMSVAIQARERIHGITEGRDERAGYTLGRMNMDGKVTGAELEAGRWYGEQMARYYGALNMGFPSARAQNLFSVRGREGDATESRIDADRRATKMYMRLEGVLLKCESGPQVKTTVFNVCVMDMDNLRMMPASQLEYLKRGLRALVFEMGLVSA